MELRSSRTIILLTFVKPAGLGIAIELWTTLTAFAGLEKGKRAKERKEE